MGPVSAYSLSVNCFAKRSSCMIFTVKEAICSSTGPSTCTSPGGRTSVHRFAKHIVEEAGRRSPQGFVRPRTAVTAVVRRRTGNLRVQIRVSASC